ncbi:MAG TPA: ABC transporter permease [Clostridia bacterium]
MKNSFLNTLKNEFLYALKNKIVFVIVFIIPIAVNFLLGYVLYNNQIRNVPMVIVDQDNSQLSRTISQQFKESEIFNVKYVSEHSGDVEKFFKEGKVRVGMIIPNDFGKDITLLKSPTIMMIYDGSHISIASAAKSKATEILLTYRTGVLLKLLKGKLNMTDDKARKTALNVQFVNRTLYNPAKSFKEFLVPGFGTAIVQTAIALLCAVGVRKRELCSRRVERAGYIPGKIFFYTVLGTLSLMICTYIDTNFFDIPLRGSFRDVFILDGAFMLAVSSFCTAVSSWVGDAMISSTINAVLFIPSTIVAGYTWPVLSMPYVYQQVAWFLPFYHYADNIRDLCLKGNTLDSMLTDIRWFLAASVIFIALGFVGVFRHGISVEPVKIECAGGEPDAAC